MPADHDRERLGVWAGGARVGGLKRARRLHRRGGGRARQHAGRGIQPDPRQVARLSVQLMALTLRRRRAIGTTCSSGNAVVVMTSGTAVIVSGGRRSPSVGLAESVTPKVSAVHPRWQGRASDRAGGGVELQPRVAAARERPYAAAIAASVSCSGRRLPRVRRHAQRLPSTVKVSVVPDWAGLEVS
jgi:hypothetical protein